MIANSVTFAGTLNGTSNRQNKGLTSGFSRCQKGGMGLRHLVSITMLAFISLLPGANAGLQASLSAPQMNVENVYVSANSKVTLDMVKKSNSNPAEWQPNMCFELTVGSPYQNPEDYSPFSADPQLAPECTPVTAGITVSCKLKDGQTDTLQFFFPTIDPSANGLATLKFDFTNFLVPFSSQTFKSRMISVKAFSDDQCRQEDSQREQFVQSVQINPRVIPSTDVKISTSSKVIAYAGDDNVLTVTFRPVVALTPSGKGTIKIYMPYWIEFGNFNEMPYNQRLSDACESSCFNLVSSGIVGSYLEVTYDQMPANCISGSDITINCKGYKNPIYQDSWAGYYVETYDDEPISRLIEKSIPTVLDATNYEPKQMDALSTILEVTPDDTTVNTASSWQINLNPTVPLGTECYIKLYFPKDLEYKFQSVEATGIFLPKNLQAILSTSDLAILPGNNDDDRTSIKFFGCNQEASLGETPFGSAIISDITTQKAVMDSDDFGIEIFKDEDCTQFIAVLNRGIKVTANQMERGFIQDMSITPLVFTVQVASLLYVKFTSSHSLYNGARVVIQMPPGLGLPADGTFVDVTPIAASTRASQAQIVGSTVVIDNFVQVEERAAGFVYHFGLSDIANQISQKDAGKFTITTYFKSETGEFYEVDTFTQQTSFTSVTGLLSANKDMEINNPLNYLDDAIYSFTFSEDSMVPKDGFIRVDFPDDVKFDAVKILETATCDPALTRCQIADDNSQSIIIQTIAEVGKQEEVVISLGGVKNARSFIPSGSFQITTFDTDRVSLIDIGYNKNIATSTAGTITLEPIGRDSTTNGDVNTYSFSLTTTVPMENNDVLKFSFPSEVVVNAGGETTLCTPQNADDNIICGISGNDIQITLDKLAVRALVDPLDPTNYSQTISWTMSNIGNPGSVAPSEGFKSLVILTPNNYLISEFKDPAGAQPIVNTIPAEIIDASLFQDSLQANIENNFTITFSPINALPATGSIKLVYPAQISLKDGVDTKCFVTTNKLFSENCQFDLDNRVITITNVFELAAPYSSQITIMLQNVLNPIDNRRFDHDGFDLTTYSDVDHLFIQDQAIDVMVPILNCDYPCASCVETNRLSCTACWQHTNDIDLKFLMLYPVSQLPGQCKTACDFDYTSNGTPDHRCTQCDESCDGCDDLENVGDVQECISCASTHPYRLLDTKKCLNTCNEGIFKKSLFETTISPENDETVCSTCDDPCFGCFGSKNFCTSCDQTAVLKNLHENKCIETCPTKTTSVAGKCIDCESPCDTCEGSPSICTLCDNSQGRKFLLNNTCYDDCPQQYANDDRNGANVCIGCLTGCDKCNVTNVTQCFNCGEKLFLFNDTCSGSCPQGWKGKNRVCVNESDDLKVLYFPFLIGALFFTLVVFLAKMKTTKVLVKGIPTKKSTQQNVVTIIALVAPLQFLASFTQVVLAIYYLTPVVLALTAIVVIGMIVAHIYYCVWYIKNFYARIPPKVGERIVHKGKDIKIETKDQAKKYPQPVDKEFSPWSIKHKFTTVCVLIGTGMLHYKLSKMFYSRFYCFDMFKGKWTKAKLLRTFQDKFTLIYLSVDIALILVGIIGLIVGQSAFNQLMITMIETILLSIYLIVLNFIERYYLKQIFDYTENEDFHKTSEAMKKYAGKKGRKLQMNQMLLKVRNSSSTTFKTNKWEDLLTMFGGRRCKSMIELSTGWPDEEDPRHVKTWPISRDLETQMEQAGLKKFTADDAYALQDNCYAEGVHKLKGKDKNIQGDAAKLEFQSALNRKHGDLMAREDEADEMHTRKGIRRRGRKNKYHNQIDLEDDQEIDPDEASDKDADLQIIKEQEEEEEALRKMVQESSKKQQEVTAARTQKINAERLTREQREERAAGEMKLKQQQEAQALKKQQMIEALRLQQEELQRKQLEEEAANILKQREQQELDEQNRKARESEDARKKYEAQEATRIKADDDEKKRRLNEEEALLAAELARAKKEKEDALDQLERERGEADARKLLENQMLQEEQDKTRQQEKDAQKLKDQQAKEERKTNEDSEKLAKQIADEKNAQDAKDAKDLEKQREKDRKDAERAAKDAEKAKKDAEAKLALETRRAKEDDEKKAETLKKEQAKTKRDKQRLMAEVDDDDEQERKMAEQQKKRSTGELQKKSTGELPKGATSVVKKETEKQNEIPDKQTNEDSQVGKNVPGSELNDNLKSVDQSQDEMDMNSHLNINKDVLKDFQQQQQQPLITIPPNSNIRTFNEHDVLGELDRDDKGNVIVLEDKNGRKHDKSRRAVNQRGYLTDPKTNDVIENMNGQPMFPAEDMDERGEIPGVFAIEKHNFNPHQILGDFDYSDGKPILMKTNQGFYIDKKARRVNNNGWYTIPNQGHIVDKDGRKKFDKKQLNGEDLHKLFNYNGKRFDIKDVMGQFDRDQNGKIVPHNNGKELLDNLGRRVNDKGYLIDESGNIIDTNNRQLWRKSDLKNGEFPKIFPFTKFNIARIQGEFESNPNGSPVLKKTTSGNGYLDKKGRLVNIKGYLIDKSGNVIDTHGKLMFDRCVLEEDGEIPVVFRTGLLRSDTASSLSRLMSEIERGNQSEYGNNRDNGGANDSAYERLKNNDGDTSVDSKMEDTPANYNIPNQRFDSEGNNEGIQEEDEGGEHMAPSDFSEQEDPTILVSRKKQKKSKKKKKAKLQTIEFLEPTNREKNMAGAYGGMARGEIRRPGIKYEKDRLNNSKKFRVSTADEPRVRAQLNELAKTTGSNFPNQAEQVLPKGSKVTDEERQQREQRRPGPPAKKQGNFMKASDGLSSHSRTDMRGNTTSKNQKQPRKTTTGQKRGINDADFEQMFGKDIDQFLEDSEWDIESQDKVSQGSRGSRASLVNAQKLKAMEKVYLKRMENRPDDRSQPMVNRTSGSGLDMQKAKQRRQKDVRGPDRETIIAVTDDPGVIHRGEILPFTTKKTFKVNK